MSKRTPLTHQEIIALTRRISEVREKETVKSLGNWMAHVVGRDLSASQVHKFADEAGINLERAPGSHSKSALAQLVAQMLVIHIEDLGGTVPNYLSMAAGGAGNAEVEAALKEAITARATAINLRRVQ